MKAPAAACSVGLLVLLSASTGLAATPAPAAPPPFVAGTYRQIDTVTKAPLPTGNQVVIIAGKGGRLGFSVNAVSQSAATGGFVAGLLPAGAPAVWSRTSEAGNCRLTFVAMPKGLKLTQDVGFGDCGFGAGANASGTYALVAEAPLKP